MSCPREWYHSFSGSWTAVTEVVRKGTTTDETVTVLETGRRLLRFAGVDLTGELNEFLRVGIPLLSSLAIPLRAVPPGT